ILSNGLSGFQKNGFIVTNELKLRLDSGMAAMDITMLYISNFKRSEESLMEQRRERLSGFFNGAKLMAIVALVIVSVALIYSLITFNREYKARMNSDKMAAKYRDDLESNKTELDARNLEIKELKDLEKFTSTGRIARTIAHEVRNPLTNILLATEQLKETTGQ